VGAKGEDGKFPLNNFRRALAVLTKKDVCYKLFHEIGPRFKTRTGGYTRIYKLAKVRQEMQLPWRSSLCSEKRKRLSHRYGQHSQLPNCRSKTGGRRVTYPFVRLVVFGGHP